MIEWFMESGRIPGIKNEQNYKPGYVVGNHLSRSDVTA